MKSWKEVAIWVTFTYIRVFLSVYRYSFLSVKPFRSSENVRSVDLVKLLKACSGKLLNLFYSGACGYVKLVVFNVDHVDIFHAVSDVFMSQHFLNS